LYKKGQITSPCISPYSPSIVKIKKYHILIQIQGADTREGTEFAELFNYSNGEEVKISPWE